MNKITYDARCEVYRKAIERWGDLQIIVAIEEMSEVIKALTKFWRCPIEDADVSQLHDIAEEVADATIMLEQLRLIFGINDEVCKVMDSKIERLKARVSDA